jgi:sulfite dehydrogenase
MKRSEFTRRDVLKFGASTAVTATLAACAAAPKKSAGKVVVIGGGFGGATAAKYLRRWSAGTIDVTLIEPNRQFVSCPISNLVLGGSKTLADITSD